MSSPSLPEPPRKPSGGRRRVAKIPRLERRPVDPDLISKPDQRAVAVVNMRIAGTPWPVIAEELSYTSPAAAEQAYINALANLYPVEAAENLRQTEAMRAEVLFRQSLAMAQADYLVVDELDEDEKSETYGQMIQHRVENTDKLRWHEQAGKDLALHAAITGAKAPARVEVNATTAELNQMVQALIAQRISDSDEQIIEADVWDVDDIEDIGELEQP